MTLSELLADTEWLLRERRVALLAEQRQQRDDLDANIRQVEIAIAEVAATPAIEDVIRRLRRLGLLDELNRSRDNGA